MDNFKFELGIAYSVTVNNCPAEYDPATGEVKWQRAIGSLRYNPTTDRCGHWMGNLYVVDGKSIRFTAPLS